MKTIHSAAFALGALLLAASCGCTSAPTIARGQNPILDSAVTPAGHGGPAVYGSHGSHPAPLEAMGDYSHYTDVSRYEVDANGQVVPYRPLGHMSTSFTGHGQSCPICQGHSSPGQSCPACQNQSNDYPRHHFSYSYIRPKNLQYPPPAVPGGAVVYPYYTHKSPSDFFRAD